MNLALAAKRWGMPEQRQVLERLRDAGMDPDEARAAWEEHFRYVALRLAVPLARFGLASKRVLDTGSGWGEHLIHFGEGSVGVELDDVRAEFTRRCGLTVVSANLEENPDIPGAPFDAIWCSNLLEHVVAPHLFLLVLRRYLVPGGLALISIPVVPRGPIAAWANRRLVGFEGYEAENHVNAFTLATARFTIERAGYRVLEASPYVPPWGNVWRWANPVVSWAYAHTTIVARPVPGPIFPPDKRSPETLPKWAEQAGISYEGPPGES